MKTQKSQWALNLTAKFIVDIHIYCANKKQFYDAERFMQFTELPKKVTEG